MTNETINPRTIRELKFLIEKLPEGSPVIYISPPGQNTEFNVSVMSGNKHPRPALIIEATVYTDNHEAYEND